MVTAIALLVVLDRLGVADAAGRCPRSCAGGLFRNLVAATVLVYDLGAHGGGRGYGSGEGAAARRGEGAFCNGVEGKGEGETAGDSREGGVGAARR